MREFLCAVMILCSSLWGMFGFLDTNAEVIHPSEISQVLIVYGVFVGFAYLLFWLLRFAKVSRELSAVSVSLFSFFVLNYANSKALIFPLLKAQGQASVVANWPYIFLFFSAIPLWIALFARKDKFNLFNYVLVFLLVMSLGSSYQAWTFYEKINTKIQRDIDRGSSFQKVKTDKSLPNVYFILLDGYTAHDNMKKYYGYDNTSFLKSLETKGFHMSTKALSNHDNTLCTVTTMTNMNYLPINKTGVTELNVMNSGLFRGRFSPIFQEMGNLGYTSVLSTLGAQMSIGPDGDSISPPIRVLGTDYKGRSATYVLPVQRSGASYIRLSQASSSFLSLSPAMDLLTKLNLNVPSDYSELADIDALFALGDKAPKPYFYYGHILLPHLPGRYDKACRPKAGNQLLRHDFSDDIEGGQDLADDYRDNAQCVSSQFEKFVDKIIEKDPNSIIIVTADHGAWYQWQKMLEKTQSTIAKDITPEERQKRLINQLSSFSPAKDLNGGVRVKYGILSGYRLPNGEADPEWYDGMSPVNYFRWLLRKLGKSDVKYLPDRVFIGNDVNHYFVDITPMITDDRKPTGPLEPGS